MIRSARPYAILALALALLALHPVSPVFTDPATAVEVKSGDDFFIAIPSNVTTGYTWSQKIADASVLAYEGSVYQNPENGRIGASGQQLFVFHAEKSGTTSIAFSYARPFEPHTPPAKSVTFTVTVH